MSIKPEAPGGFRDYLPEQEYFRRRMIGSVVDVFERFGFLPTDTPGVEKKDILTGGDSEFEKELFSLERGEGKEELALRFDLTVPLARLIAANPDEIHNPFRRYQVGRTWRGEKPQKGRYREFLQCDIDIVGAKDSLADAEVIAVMAEVMRALGVEDFIIKINNRKILNGLGLVAGLSDAQRDPVFRALDKVEKIGVKDVLQEIEGVADKKTVKFFDDYLKLAEKFSDGSGKESLEVLDGVMKLASENETVAEGVEELKEIVRRLDVLGVSENRWRVDASIVRGLGYYTGSIFETVIAGSDMGSVFSGGRYDNLLEKYSGSAVPAVGASLGLDRLFAVLEDSGALTEKGAEPRVMVLNFSPECEDSVLRLATQLRRSNIKTDLYAGNEKTLKGQLAHATRLDIPLVCILGPKEKEKGTVQVKYMKERKQQEFNRNDFLKSLGEIFS